MKMNCLPKTADACVQTETIERDYVSLKQLSLMQTESIAFPQFLYHQHTLFQLIAVLAALGFAGFYYVHPPSETSLLNNAHMGIMAAMLTIVVYCIIYLPNTILQRPHSSLWRMLQGLCMCWLCAVVFALFFNREDLQTFLQSFVDPNLGVPTNEKNFSEDCRIFTPDHEKGPFGNIIDKLDWFFVAHFVGWLVKMFICRDFWLCMSQSILFEFIEITFRHWLPNFYECWWDSIIFDLLLCNAGGIIFGHWLIKVFGMKEYKWTIDTAASKQKPLMLSIKELFITPNLEKHEWKMFSSTFRYVSVIYFIILMNMVDLSFFFNKYVLWLPPTHPILSFRTFMIGFLSIPASREFYEYVSNPLGGIIWLLQATVFAEFLVFFKNQNGQFTEAFPEYVIQIWSVIGILALLIFFALLYRDIKRALSSRKQDESQLLETTNIHEE